MRLLLSLRQEGVLNILCDHIGDEHWCRMLDWLEMNQGVATYLLSAHEKSLIKPLLGILPTGSQSQLLQRGHLGGLTTARLGVC